MTMHTWLPRSSDHTVSHPPPREARERPCDATRSHQFHRAFSSFSSVPPLRSIRQSNNITKAISRFQILFSQTYALSRSITVCQRAPQDTEGKTKKKETNMADFEQNSRDKKRGSPACEPDCRRLIV